MKTILYVEDDQQNVSVAQLRLGRRYKMLIAPDDVTACTLLKQYGDEITAVLMDIELKGSKLDGLALTRLMRGKIAQDKLPDYAKGVKVSTVPVIIVSAYAEEGPRALDLSGADQFFAKPVDFIKLSLALATISAQTAMRMLDVSKAT